MVYNVDFTLFLDTDVKDSEEEIGKLISRYLNSSDSAVRNINVKFIEEAGE